MANYTEAHWNEKKVGLMETCFNNEKGEVPLLYRWGMNPSKVRNKCSSLY